MITPSASNHHAGIDAGHQSLGLYVHIPFCRRKCRYCNFYSVTDLDLRRRYIRCLLAEIKAHAAPTMTVDSIYFGGGTPSVIAAADIGRVLEAIDNRYRIAADSEITIEVNPGTVTARSLANYRRLGLNRINIGVQSFSDATLEFLGRMHTADKALQTVEWARQAGFDNIGLDLICGIVHQSISDWETDLDQAVSLAPEHLACYLLSFEAGTPLRVDLDAGCFPAPDEASLANLYLYTVHFLAHRGYEQYEISNFSRCGAWRSRHNLKYWSATPYIGFGPSAHSFLPPKRFWNVTELPDYCRAVEDKRMPIGGQERLTAEQMRIERLYLGLRQTAGIDLEAFDTLFHTTFTTEYNSLIDELSRRRLIRIEDRRCRLSRKGMVLINPIVEQFVGQIEPTPVGVDPLKNNGLRQTSY